MLLFFLYASLLFHSDWMEQETLWLGAVVVLLVLTLFSAVFIGYSHRLFLQARLREWGLLRVMGMDAWRAAKMVGLENVWIGTLTLFVGIGLGHVFSKLFALTVSMVIGLPEPLTLPFSSGAAILTVVVFGCIFMVNSLLTPGYLMRMKGVDLLQNPGRVNWGRFSGIGWILGVILLIASIGVLYGGKSLTLKVSLAGGGLLWVGMYLLLHYGGGALVHSLKKNPRIQSRVHWFLSLSLLEDHGRGRGPVWVMAVILHLLALMTLHLYFNFYTTAEHRAILEKPFSLSYIEAPGEKATDLIEKVLQKHGLQVSAREKVPALQGSLSRKGEAQVAILSLSDFNRLLKRFDRHPPLHVQEGEGLYVFPYHSLGGQPEHRIRLFLEDRQITLPLRERYTVRVFNEHRFTERVVILDDATFNRLFDQYGRQRGYIIYGWVLFDWKKSGPAVEEIQKNPKMQKASLPITTVEAWQWLKQLFSSLLFSSLFMGLLLFLAAGSLLYFHVFAGERRDTEKMGILHSMGLSWQEWERAVTLQIRILFFLPLLVAMGLFFLFHNRIPLFTEVPNWRQLGTAYSLYAVVYSIYCRITAKAYLFRVRQENHRRKSRL